MTLPRRPPAARANGARRVRQFVLAFVAAAVLVPTGPAAASPIFAIGDNSPDTFVDPAFKALHVKRTRAVIPWNSVLTASGRATWDAWFQAVRQARLEPVVAFAAAEGSKCPQNPCVLPSSRTYGSMLRAFIRRYPQVRIYTPWDEPNSVTEPTHTSRGAAQLAEYYRVVKEACRRCTVLGGDVQDIRGFTTYMRTYMKALGDDKPEVWGFHNYSDVNRGGSANTRAYLGLVRGPVWLTETGGLYSFSAGGDNFPPDAARQARATAALYTLARRYERQIQRVYIYNWRADPTDRFDAGLEAPDGALRPAYSVVLRNRALFR